MSDATFGQAAHALTLIGQKRPSMETLAGLYSSGLLSDLLEVADASAIDRQAFRSLLGLSPLRFEFEIDYDLDFEAMVAAGHYDWRNDNLNEKNFPTKGKGKKRFEAKLFPAGCSSEEGVKRIAAEDKARPWKPAEIEHILAFGAVFPDEQRKYPIAGLGSSAEVHGRRRVPCLHGFDARRYLDLVWWDNDWSVDWRLLAVREISDPTT